jgi:hypothetical protein
MTKKNKVLILLALCMLLTAFCVLAVQYALNLCFWWDCAPKRDFVAADLRLPDNIFPEDVMVGSPSTIRDNLMIEDMFQGASWGHGTGTSYFAFSVERFPTIRGADEVYTRDKTRLSKEPWHLSSELQIEGRYADESISACGNWAGYRCEHVARYQEFLLTVNSMIDEEMTYDRFEDIAEYIDVQIAIRLYP